MSEPIIKTSTPGYPRSSSTTRSQLIWATIFPLVAFALLTILLLTAALQTFATNLILQRNTSLAQVSAGRISNRFDQMLIHLHDTADEMSTTAPVTVIDQRSSGLLLFDEGLVVTDSRGNVVATDPAHPALKGQNFAGITQADQIGRFSLSSINQNGNSKLVLAVSLMTDAENQSSLLGFFSSAQLDWLEPPEFESRQDVSLLLIDPSETVLNQSGQKIDPPEVTQAGPVQTIIQQKLSKSILTEIPALRDQRVISYAPIGNSGWGVLMEESWQVLITPVMDYAWVLGGLVILGILLSIVMLSASVDRIIMTPLADLSKQANELGPGSLFRPVEETGPVELRVLLRAFNHMVIRLAEQKAALHEYAEKTLLSQEEERQRISHELHDETIQDLVGLVQRVDLCRNEMDSDPALARHRLDELRDLAEQALDDLRRISNALRPPILQDLGLATAVQSLCDDLTQQLPQIRCTLDVSGQEGNRLAPELELAIFRVVQEALSNIRRHSKGTTRVHLTLEINASFAVATVHNNGLDFQVQDIRALVSDGHLGLAGMFERARLFNGQLTISSTPHEGTTIKLSIPIPSKAIVRIT